MSHESILLVEPPEDDRQAYADSLRDSGFAVRVAESTDEGLAAAQDADLIITAIRMPGSFDGVELVRRIRENVRTKHKPLIVFTACTFEPDQSRAFAAGCDVFLPKPCLPELLLAEAERLIAHAVALREGVHTAQNRAAELSEQPSDLRTHGLRKPKHR
jgi:CheY-like chemotaxis protein